jgi:hypothetical protein
VAWFIITENSPLCFVSKGFIKVVKNLLKNKAYFKRFQVKYKRRCEGKTGICTSTTKMRQNYLHQILRRQDVGTRPVAAARSLMNRRGGRKAQILMYTRFWCQIRCEMAGRQCRVRRRSPPPPHHLPCDSRSAG